MKIFEHRIWWSIFEPKRLEIIGNWRKLCDKELDSLSSSPDKLLLE
jgi:hypothetical protein